MAALLHESRKQAPDQIGSFLARRVTGFGMRDLSVYVTDFEQRRLNPIGGSAETASIGMVDSTRGEVVHHATETVRQLYHSVLDHHGVLSDDTTAFLVDFH